MNDTSRTTTDLLTATGKTPVVIERRQKSQHRDKRDRRRRVKRTVGLEISPTGVSLAVIERDSEDKPARLITRHQPFPENSGPTHGDWTDGTLTELLIELSAEYQLAGNAVLVGLGGNPCMTRVVMGENEDVDNDVRELTERSRRYMGMGRGEKVNCHAEARLDAKRKRAWVTVAKRAAVDAVADAVQAAGMRLGRLEHTMVVLCRILAAHNEDQDQPVLLVTDESGRLELGISYRGQLLLDYRPAMPDTDETEDVIVHRHIKCLRRYLQAKLPDTSNELSKAFITGVAPSRILDCPKLNAQSDLKITKFPTTALIHGMQAQSGVIEDDPGMLSAIWLARHDAPEAHHNASSDLMSTLRPSGNIPWMRLAMNAWPLAAAAIIACVLFGSAALEQCKAEAIEQQIAELTPDHSEAGRLRFMLQQQMQFNREIDRMGSDLSKPRWNEILYQSGSLLPQGCWLETVQIDHRPVVSFAGASFTDEAIYDYIDQLKKSGLFERVSLESTNSIRVGSGPAFRFEISAEARDRKSIRAGIKNLTQINQSNLSFNQTAHDTSTSNSANQIVFGRLRIQAVRSIRNG